jgi:hypothetical protein
LKGDKFDGCSMSRSTDELDITFLRAQDGLLLLLDSQKWKLERRKGIYRSPGRGLAIGRSEGIG